MLSKSRATLKKPSSECLVGLSSKISKVTSRDENLPTVKSTNSIDNLCKISSNPSSNILNKKALVKRPSRPQNLDQEWLDFLGNKDDKLLGNDEGDRTKLGFNLGKSSSEPEVVDNSLLGRFIKRQRVNSAANKHELSFIPKAKQSANATSSANVSPILKPTAEPLRKRDLKDASKTIKSDLSGKQMESDFSKFITVKKDQDSNNPAPLPRVDVKLRGLNSDDFLKQPIDNNRRPSFNNGNPSPCEPKIPKSVKFNFRPTVADKTGCNANADSQQKDVPTAKSGPVNPTFTTKRDSKPNGLRDKAMQLVARFGGEFLSEKRLSIVKGAEAFKFKCINGHVFYKFVTELQ